MHRLLFSIQLAAALSAAGAQAPSASRSAQGMELNTNRSGGDYRSIDLDGDDPAPCKAACDGEAKCKAWTFVKPDSPGGKSYCWLKDSVPQAAREDCCVSGVKRAAGGGGTATSTGQTTSTSQSSGMELNTNRSGSDYRSIDLTGNNAAPCKAACDKEAKCKAWTFVKPESPGGPAYCWLKDLVPPPAPDRCCVSGVKQAGGGTTTTTSGGTTTTSTGGASSMERNTNRNGGDYRAIDLTGNNAAPCKAACDKEAACKAWTFVKPDSPGGRAYCWLKDSVPPPAPDPCCTSGVKQ